MDYYIVSSTIANLFTVSDAGSFGLAQFNDYFSLTGGSFTGPKMAVAVLSGLMLIALITVIVKLNGLSAKKVSVSKVLSPPSSASSGIMARWEEVQKHIVSTREAEWKFAVIEADKLVDDVLKTSYPGETMGERLMSITKGQLETLDGLWEAHKTRNRLVHDTNYFLRYAEAKKAVTLYERSLRELHAI